MNSSPESIDFSEKRTDSIFLTDPLIQIFPHSHFSFFSAMIARDWRRRLGVITSVSMYISAHMTMRLRERSLSNVRATFEYVTNSELGLFSVRNIIDLLNDWAQTPFIFVLIFAVAFRMIIDIFLRTTFENAVIEAELNDPPTS
jgi:hypothetical protein